MEIKDELKDLPHDLLVEQTVLGCLLLDGRVFPEFVLEPDDFYEEEHRYIYKVMINLYKQSRFIEIVSVREELKKIDKLVFVGGDSYLLNLVAGVPFVANFSYYAKIIKEKSLARQLFQKSLEIGNFAVSEDIGMALKEAMEIETLGLTKDVSFSDMFTEEDLERLSKSKRFTSDLLFDLTKFIWFVRAEVIYIAGRTSVGKTQLAINLFQAFLKQGAKIGYLSFEIGKEQLLKRLISWETGLPLREIDIRDPKWFKFGQELLTQDIFKNFRFKDDIFDINEIISWIESHDFDVVFLDYIQMIHDRTFRGNRNEEIGRIAETFRRMSKKRCMVVMSQFNRRPGEDETEVDLSRMRDSGEIEQTATSVILIRRDKGDKNTFYYAVAKNSTNGLLTHGWVTLRFEAGGKFKEVNK